MMSDRPTDTATGGGRSSPRRAVSYALGFVLVFSVVVAGTLALFALGVDVLADVDRDEALLTNEEAVKMIHSELNDMAAQGGARRDVALELVDAQLRAGDRQLRVRVESEALNETLSYDTDTLVYEVPDYGVTFVYALGHVYRIDEPDGGGRSVRSELLPAFETSNERTRLAVPMVGGGAGPDSIAVSGTGERTVVAHRSGPPTAVTRTGTNATGVTAVNGSVTVEGVVNPSVWVSALEATGFEAVSTGPPGTVTGRFETARLTVLATDIAVTLGTEGWS